MYALLQKIAEELSAISGQTWTAERYTYGFTDETCSRRGFLVDENGRKLFCHN